MKKNKEYNEDKETNRILWMIFFVPIIFFILDLANLGHLFFPYIDNLTIKYDWLSFIGSYAGTIVSAIFLLIITKMDRRDNNEILREAQRPYLDVNYTIIDSNFINANKTDINRRIYFFELFGMDKYEKGKEYLSIEIHNTGASTAILNVNESNFILKYRKYIETVDGEKEFRDEKCKINLNSIVKRKSIAANESMFIVIDSILLYNTKNWELDSNVTIENSKVIYKDLFNYKYMDLCNYEERKTIPISDNQVIEKNKSNFN